MKYIKLNNIISSFVIFISSCNTIKTNYYFPKGFFGDVAIVYNYEGGQDVHIKNGTRQILIPNSGIVLLKTHFKEGQLDEKFYIKDEKENFKEVYRYTFQKDTCCDKKYIYFERVVEFVGKTKNNNSFVSMINFFYIGKSLELDTNRYFFENQVQNLLGSKVYRTGPDRELLRQQDANSVDYEQH